MNAMHVTSRRLSRADIEIIDAIVQRRSVTQAAKTLHRSQSAVSHHLSGLEDRLGTPLFDRAGRQIVPTAAGMELAKHAQLLLRQFAQAEAVFNGASRCLIRIGTECFTSYHWLPTALRRWRQTNPGLEVQIIMEATQRPVPALLGGEVDLVLVHSADIHPQVESASLFKDELVLIAPADHRLASQPCVELKALGKERLILHSTAEGRNPFLDVTLAAHGIRPREIWKVQLTDVILELVGAGEGISVLARWLVQPNLAGRSLKMVRLGKRGVYRRWRLLARRGGEHAKSLPIYAKQLVEGLENDGTILTSR
jgi:LysR family transcriptional regulator, regulator for metE and metH